MSQPRATGLGTRRSLEGMVRNLDPTSTKVSNGDRVCIEVCLVERTNERPKKLAGSRWLHSVSRQHGTHWFLKPALPSACSRVLRNGRLAELAIFFEDSRAGSSGISRNCGNKKCRWFAVIDTWFWGLRGCLWYFRERGGRRECGLQQ